MAAKHLENLSNRELAILRFLSRGHSYAEIAGFAKTTVSSIYSHCLHIRRKTGIYDTQDKRECAQFLQRKGRFALRRKLCPTDTQLEVMRRYCMEGQTLDQIAQAMGMGRQTAQNHLSIGCRRAEIGGFGYYLNRLPEMRAFFEQTMTWLDDPMFQ
jgi:DNA-binding CsgD family transcriptional regulator